MEIIIFGEIDVRRGLMDDGQKKAAS